MKPELQELFDGLDKLCSETEAFYFSEQEYEAAKQFYEFEVEKQ